MSNSNDSKKRSIVIWLVRHGGVMFATIIMILWACIVWWSAAGWNPSQTEWNFENTGQLGDSFGVLSSIMAAVAAYFAFRTYQAAQDDIARLEQRAAEPSYLNLLERRFDVLDRVRLSRLRYYSEGPEGYELLGSVAVDWISSGLRNWKEKNITLKRAFFDITRDVSGLSNLLRFTYHIVSFADRQFSKISENENMLKNDPAYQYIRLLRAQLSNSELVVIAINCAFGPGHDKFKPLVERYALLHNLNRRDIDLFELRGLFAPTAFGLSSMDRVRSDSPEEDDSDKRGGGEPDPDIELQEQ